MHLLTPPHRLGVALALGFMLWLPDPAPAQNDAPPVRIETETPVDAPRSAPSREAPSLPEDRPLHVAFLVVDGVYNTELTAPWDVLEHVTYHVGEGESPGTRVFAVSPDGQPVTTAEGLVIVPEFSFAKHPSVDVLVVPSSQGSRDADLENVAMVDWVRRVGGEARYVVSLCWGAFVLGEAGLLDGRAATTFPRDYERFADAFPDTRLRIHVSFVHDGKVLTSQGGIRSFDVALYLVDRLYGQETAAKIGGGLLIPWPPDPETGPEWAVVAAP